MLAEIEQKELKELVVEAERRETIQRRTDLDFYKLTMGQFVERNFPRVEVEYELINRDKRARLKDYISKASLEAEIRRIKELHLSAREALYISRLGEGKSFDDEFIKKMSEGELPMPIVIEDDGDLKVTVKGEWSKAIWWETYLLSAINELYFVKKTDTFDHDELLDEGRRRLWEKIEILKQHPEIKFIEFGTRRRFSFDWQEEVVATLKSELPGNLIGTSNVHLAEKYDLKPIGTMAHEVHMVASALMHKAVEEGVFETYEEAMKASVGIMSDLWEEMYKDQYLIALPDTYGTDFFLENFGEERARRWAGMRQDSGDPFEFGEKIIKYYESLGINPGEKTIVFSDGLDIETILAIQARFGQRVKVVFGWGTNLTNDLGLKALKIVMKPVSADSWDLVKLSDNIAKATGKPKEVEKFKRVVGYDGEYNQPVNY